MDEETAENIVSKLDKEGIKSLILMQIICLVVLPKLIVMIFRTDNYPYKYGYMTGSQFIAVNYSNIDENMDNI